MLLFPAVTFSILYCSTCLRIALFYMVLNYTAALHTCQYCSRIYWKDIYEDYFTVLQRVFRTSTLGMRACSKSWSVLCNINNSLFTAVPSVYQIPLLWHDDFIVLSAACRKIIKQENSLWNTKQLCYINIITVAKVSGIAVNMLFGGRRSCMGYHWIGHCRVPIGCL